MNDSTKLALAAAVAGGYVLGRTRKAKLAFGMATYLLGRRIGVSPQQLLAEGVRRLADSPQFSQLGDQIRGELKDAGLARLDSLADALHERTQLLGVAPEAPEDEYEDEEHVEEEEERGRGRPSGRRAPKAQRPPAAKAAAPAKKTAAKKAAKKGAAAKKSAKSAAKKTSARPGRGR